MTSPGTSDDAMDVDVSGVDEEKELDGDLWEDDDSEEEEADCRRMAEARELASSSVMDIEEAEGVNVGIPDLLDLLSDRPASRPSESVGVEIQPNLARKANLQTPRVFQVSDIQF